MPRSPRTPKINHEAMARTVSWVRLLRTRLPAFDGMDAGDLALIPLTTLRAVAPDEASRREMVEYLADHNATGILVISSDESDAESDTALAHLVAAAAVSGCITDVRKLLS